ncbi:glutaredoxin domain-containing protein [Ornithinimicrobium panacihumi]|uniref:glutaredoxin domain-containing protein n=1 Tax=Ornithinimicrobium panacihumi TaxID=2008449 RepID=UPI003F8BBD9F
MRSRWLWLLFLAVLAYVVWDFLSDGRPWLALGYGVLATGIAWWTSPWRGRSTTTHQEVQAMADTDPRKDVVIYWRPGCGYCARLKSTLGDAGKDATWINIWQDEEAAAFVRSVNEGNEVVPTVVMDGIPVTNPRPTIVLERLQRD